MIWRHMSWKPCILNFKCSDLGVKNSTKGHQIPWPPTLFLSFVFPKERRGMCKQEKRYIQGGNSMVHEDDASPPPLIYK